MGVLSNLTELVTSGVTWAFNKIVSSGAWVIAAGTAVMTWITSKLVAGVSAAIEPLLSSLPNLAQSFTGFGLWAFGLFALPLILPQFAGLAVRFIIRRIPVIG